MTPSARRAEFGDFQTPPPLAAAICAALAAAGHTPAAIVEPTCGDGHFLAAAAATWPAARRIGVELDPAHAARARALDPAAEILTADAFTHDWPAQLAPLPAPLLILGNPPWITTAGVAALGGRNRPARTNPGRLTGLDALLGHSNFDVSEWLTLRLLAALEGHPDATLALLLKTATIRRICAHHWRHGPPLAAARQHHIDARRAFDAAVDAALFVARPGAPATLDCATHPTLTAPATGAFGWRDDRLVADAAAYDRARPHLGGGPRWRSGVKHDCAAILELRPHARGWRNGLGEHVTLERHALYPLMKSADVARGRPPSRALLLTQRATDDDPARLAAEAPRAYAYLRSHADRLDRRQSAIYRGRPRFSIFGVGPYAFTDYKVAISGLYPIPRFAVIGPHDGRPVLFDDTVYFLPCADEAQAQTIAAALDSPPGRDAIAALSFPDAKRTVTAALLGQIDLARLTEGTEQT
ncbi:MAG: SAM-dependent DNA methyltransferase [bacterium]